MKQTRILLSFIIVVAILLASTLSVNAIGFEAENAYESVFVIYSGNALGSGWAIGENCIVTNAHVIDNPRSITIVTYGGSEYAASVIGINEQEDIAILAVNGAKFPYLSIADLTTMKTGDDIYAIGAPKGMAYTLTKGGISAKERMIDGQSYIQIDAPINEGNSGGPLLNDAGQVLGMNTLKMTDSEGIGLAIPVNRVCDYLKTLNITMDETGNVAGSVDVPETNGSPVPPHNHENQDEDKDKTEKQDNRKTVAYASVAVIVATLSMAGNVLLLVLLIIEKKKKVSAPYDPSERTDFEIDILEG